MSSPRDMRAGADSQPVTRLLIEAYGAGGFRIGGARIDGSVLLDAGRVLPWPARSLTDATADSLAALFAGAPEFELLLLGCGLESPAGARPEMRAAMAARGIRVESMSTGAACRTFNVLAAERRPVAAALIAV